MFTAAEIQLIRAHCPSDFESLLRELSVSVDWSGDEYRIAEKVDDDITKKISALMKSSSIIAGYKSLLKIGGIAYDYSESDNELLAKIVANSEKILRGLEIAPETSKTSTQARTQTVTKEEHVTLTGPIILGVILIVAGAAGSFALDNTIVGALAVVLGIISAIAGVRGKTKQVTTTVPVTSNPVHEEKKSSFTPNELQKVLDVLKKLNKIVRAI